MARTYGKLMSSIWRDEDFKGLPTPEAQLLYLALISQPDLSPCGRLTVALGRWADGIAGSTRTTVTAALEALEAARFVVIDWNNDELLVRSFVRNDNGLGNPRRRAAIKNAAREIGSPALWDALRAENPGVFDDDHADIHSQTAEPVDNRKTPGHSSNVRRTGSEPTVCTAMPNPGDVRREPGDVNREPGTVIPEQASSSRTQTSSADTATKRNRIIGTIVDIRADGQPKGTPWRTKVAADVDRTHGPKLDDWLVRFPDAPVDVLAAALETGDSRSLGYYAPQAELPDEPVTRMTREERDALIASAKEDQ